MSLIVQKFGGSSVADADGIKRVAKRIVDTHQAGNKVVVIVSAMGDTTDELIDLAASVTDAPSAREMDILLTAGERISMALLAMAVTDLGVHAHAFTGQQAGLHTDTAYGKASIVGVVPERIARVLQADEIAIIAGFQGVNIHEDVTTLGRGGSDTTAVAFAAALRADVCEIYSDVDGVLTADPRICKSARQIPALTYEETLEMAAHGAKILHLRAVEYARRYDVPLHVRSSFSNKEGTWIVNESTRSRWDGDNEAPIISGISHDTSQAKITITRVPDEPGAAARIFQVVADAGSSIDMIVQNVPVNQPGQANISFTLPIAEVQLAVDALEAARESLGFDQIQQDDGVGILSLIGTGMRSHPGVTAKFFAALAEAGINIDMISTSEIRISTVLDARDVPEAVRVVHTAFDLDAEEEAIVYGGSGR
ncbi:aspartate kinase [Trueperella pecoris]|uniref:Aspartokinase n=1 Tax=Trueperella pecoris TaxID=2733571 RepID=A0A7M1QUJ8_9ACTO|nr:aspartate kinase [Trueperella pecoris]QOQ38060.1 aspartate kinase [Trueperella pecoris]QOR45493.1 aspartate kinase [Trueperella pecoris]QTG75333.1 aspartate kinase [Trueperella pecoris]